MIQRISVGTAVVDDLQNPNGLEDLPQASGLKSIPAQGGDVKQI